MRQSRLWRDARLLTLAIFFAGGCAANMPAPRAVGEPAIARKMSSHNETRRELPTPWSLPPWQAK